MAALVALALCAGAPDPGADVVVARAFVPSPEQRVGEVRLLRRGDAEVVQTLLYTKVLSRVVGEIRRKELANWPSGPGHDDALRYVAALEAQQQALWAQVQAAGPRADRRQKLWIEFVVSPKRAFVALGSFDASGSPDDLKAASRTTLATLEPSRDYVRRNMALIAADAFHAEGAALAALLAPLPLVQAGAAGAGPSAPAGAIDAKPGGRGER